MAYFTRYYTDYLYLPRINAVSEGLTSIAFISIFSWFVGGKSFWLSSPLGIQNNQILLVLPLITFIGNMRVNCGNILRKTSLNDMSESMRFMLQVVCSTLFCHASGKVDGFSYMYVFIANYAKTTIICQLSHAAGIEYRPFRLVNSLVVVCTWLNGVPLWTSTELRIVGIVLLVVSLADFAVFAWTVTVKTSELLSIPIFSVIKRPK